MIETWVNIIETLICIHIIQKIKKIIPEKEEEKENKEQNEGKEEQKEEEEKGESLLGKIKNYDYKGLLGSNEEKESMFEPYEILEHKYYEKMQQLVVKLKEEQSQLKYQLGSTQDAYEFKLDINLEATQSKIPITRESLLSLNDIFTKTKRFMKGDKKTWKENVTEFINKHFMNDLVDDIVTKSHYNSSNVMSIIKDQIPQLRFLNETNMKENFFSTIVEQEGKQYDDKTKTKFTKYYHHFFLENLNGNVKTTEGLKELENLLKEFQKLREPELYAKEVLEKIDMTYEPNLNLMRDFVKGNMKTKFEAYVESRVEIIDSSVELKTERVIELIKEVSVKLEEQQVKVENKEKEIDAKLEALQRENEQYIAEIKAMKEEHNRLETEKNIASKNDENLRSKLEEKNNKLSLDLLKKSKENEAQMVKLQIQKEENSEQMVKLKEQEEQNTKLKNDLEMLNIKHEENINKIKNDNTADKEKAIEELKENHEKNIAEITKELNSIIITNQSLNETIKNQYAQIVELQESIKKINGLTDTQRQEIKTMETNHKENIEKLKAEYKAKVAKLKQNYDTGLKTEEERNTETLKEAADRLEEDYKKELNELQNKHLSDLQLLKNQIEELNKDNENLRNIIIQKDKDIGSLKEIEEKLINLNNDNEDKINELASKITDLEHINKQEKEGIINGINEYAKKLSKFKPNEENTLNKENNNDLKLINNSLATHIERLTYENIKLKEELKLKNEEENKTQTTNKELQEKFDFLEQQKNDLESQLTLTKNELETKEDELNASKAKLQATQEEKDRLQNNIEIQKAKIKELKDNNDVLKQANAQNQEQINMQQEEINEQEKIISKLRKQLKAKNEEIAAKEAKLKEDELTMTKLGEKIGKQEEEIDKLTSEKEQVEAELNAKKAKEEDEERKRKAEEERKRLAEEAQRQKDEAERIRKEEEEKERPKKEAILNIKQFLDTINKIKSQLIEITFTYYKSNNEKKYDIDHVKLNNAVTEYKKEEIKSRRNQIIKDDNNLNTIFKNIDKYINTFTKFQQFIENNKIDEEILTQWFNYLFENEKAQIQEYIGNKITLPNLDTNTIEILNRNILNIVENIIKICKNTNNRTNELNKKETRSSVKNKLEELLKDSGISCDNLMTETNVLKKIIDNGKFVNLFILTKKSIEKFLKNEIKNMPKNIETPQKQNDLQNKTPGSEDTKMQPYNSDSDLSDDEKRLKRDDTEPILGGKKKTRRKGRTKKKTKTRKK